MKFGVMISVLCFWVISFSGVVEAQELNGMWIGNLEIQGQELPLVFNFSTSEGKITGTVESPKQGARGIKITKAELIKSDISVEIKSIMASYKGKVNFDENVIKGTFSQGGMKLPLILKKTDKKFELKRPQMPKAPFNYDAEEVSIVNLEDEEVVLAGTLTLPKGKGPFPVAVLVSGSGGQDRDETLLGHKPFWVIADHLTKNGIAVLRCDDRGVAKSKGNFATATTLDFVKDAISAVEFLKKDSRFSEIGIIGHSEGGLVAPIAAAQNENIDFIVMLAGPGISGGEIIVRQVELMAIAEGMSKEKAAELKEQQQEIIDIVTSTLSKKDKKEKLTAILKTRTKFDTLDETKQKKTEQIISMQIRQLLSPWYRLFTEIDPYDTITEVECPVLAINGANDTQVPADINLQKIEEALVEGGNDKYKIVKLEGLNHLFQHCETGASSRYGEIEETFAPEALELITNWIKENTGK